MRVAVILFAVLVWLATSAVGEVRVWSDAAGRTTFQAELVRLDGEIAVLRLEVDGKAGEYRLPLNLLSSADQNYVRSKFRTPSRPSSGTGGIPASVLSKIKEKAAGDWPGDFDMQKFVIDKQKAAYLQVQNYRNPSVRSSVLQEIIRKAKQQWPEDYDMQKFVIEKQTAAYNDLQRGD